MGNGLKSIIGSNRSFSQDRWSRTEADKPTEDAAELKC